MESKLPSTGTTIFAVMSALSEECNAINLSQGFPSFNPDQSLLDAVSRNLNDLSLIHISEPTRLRRKSRMPSSA